LGISIEASRLTPAKRVQLDLSRDTSVSPDALSVLLAELCTEIGAERVGVLQIPNTHIPEKRSVLNPRVELDTRTAQTSTQAPLGSHITRLLVQTQALGSWEIFKKCVDKSADNPKLKQASSTTPIVASISFDLRLDGIEWWTDQPIRRDYMIASMRQGDSWTKAWIYLDRGTGEVFLHGWLD